MFAKNSISRNQGNLDGIPDLAKTRGHFYLMDTSVVTKISMKLSGKPGSFSINILK